MVNSYFSRVKILGKWGMCQFPGFIYTDDHFSLVRQGSVRLALKFSASLDNTVTVVAYAEFENVVEVDRDGNVIFDFGV